MLTSEYSAATKKAFAATSRITPSTSVGGAPPIDLAAARRYASPDDGNPDDGDMPGCYHAHPLFRELLRAQLAYESPQLLPGLHERAGLWFADAGMIDQDMPHDFGAHREELSAGFPLGVAQTIDPDKEFIHQGTGFKRLIGAFLIELPARQASQLLKDNWPQLFLGGRISLTPGTKQCIKLCQIHSCP